MSKDNDVKVYNVPYEGSNPIHLIKNIIYIWKHSTSHGVNHITGDIHYGILGLIGKKSVLTIHDDYAMRMAHRGIFDKIFKYVFWIYLPIKLAKVPVCISPATLKNILRYYHSKKLRILTHHSVPYLLYPQNKTFCKKYPRILQVGATYQKNLETTIKALHGMACQLVVLKKMTPKQKELADKLHVKYINRYNLPYEEVVAEYNQADIVVFPSLFEGLGVPIFEGQAAGKPVITTDKEPMNWVAGNGAVLLKNPLDVDEYKKALFKIINDDGFRTDLVRKGLANSKRFSLENSVRNYYNLYESL